MTAERQHKPITTLATRVVRGDGTVLVDGTAACWTMPLGRSPGLRRHLTKLCAHFPEALAPPSYALDVAISIAKLDFQTRAPLTTACTSSIGDAHCSLAFGSELATKVGADAAAEVVRGDDSALTATDRMLADWARRVAETTSRSSRSPCSSPCGWPSRRSTTH